MCNLAGYVGTEAAAPILLEMTRRQEGLAGGYYTGIATIADGKLHYRKVVGDVATLVKQTDAADLPGTVGIIHSRSKSGGGAQWAHPFIDCTGRMAYAATGIGGFFADRRDPDTVLRGLADAGHVFRSRNKKAVGKYPTLADGSSVHVSEVVCHLIESHIARGLDPALAMREAFQDFVAELIGLIIHEDTPDSIIASRINQPLMIGRRGSSTFLATTTLAFPEGAVDWVMSMPLSSTAVIKGDGLSIIPMDATAGPVCKIPPWQKGFETVLALLADGEPKSFGTYMKATTPLWPKDQAPQREAMTYAIVEDLHARGLIDFVAVEKPGMEPGSVTHEKQIFTNLYP
jgi:glucosamine--fructose-6-phosphate aminotransferase (isomerizing)